MDSSDKKILENEIAGPVGKAVSQWMRKNDISEPVSVRVSVFSPTCYIDEDGVTHNGRVILCNVDIFDDDDYDEEDY